MQVFHFDVGDSLQSAVGLCMSVNAESIENAVIIANEFFAGLDATEIEIGDCGSQNDHTGSVVYCNVYLNPKGGMTAKDVDDIGETEEPARLRQAQKDLDKLHAIPPVTAEIYSDDRYKHKRFSVNRWLWQASNAEILALFKCGWGGDWAADEVARFMESRDVSVEKVLDYARQEEHKGFEVHVDSVSAEAWLAEHRPDVLKAIL